MIIPKNYRKELRSAGFHYWMWKRIWDWAFGERYQFTDGCIAYIKNNEIVTIRRGDRILWRKDL